jgi:hypothetical protein
MERLYKPLALRNAPVMFVSRIGGACQICRQRLPRHEISFINEIADQARRPAPMCRSGDGHQPTGASATSSCIRARLWRFLLPQGRGRPDPHRAQARSPLSLIGRCRR